MQVQLIFSAASLKEAKAFGSIVDLVVSTIPEEGSKDSDVLDVKASSTSAKKAELTSAKEEKARKKAQKATSTSSDDDDDFDFGVATKEDDQDEDLIHEEIDDNSDDDDDDVETAPKRKRGRPKSEPEAKPAALKLENIIDAFKKYATENSREAAGKILAKFDVKSVRELSASDYPKILKMLSK